MLFLSLPLPMLRAVRMMELSTAFAGRKMVLRAVHVDNEVTGGKSSLGP